MTGQPRRRFLYLALSVGAAALVLAGLWAMVWHRDGGSEPSGRLGGAYEGSELEGAAPGFRLVDQNGAARSLADFRGRVVVLTVLDPDCTDICPISAYQYRLAYEALGQDAAKVALLAFNANNRKTAVEDVAAASRKWGVDAVPIWHFLTGSAEALEAVWKAYGVMSSGLPKPGKPEELQHSPGFFVIDQAGRRRWFFSVNFEGAAPASVLILKHVRALLDEAER